MIGLVAQDPNSVRYFLQCQKKKVLKSEPIFPPLESREPRNIVLSKFCSEIDRKFDVSLIACISVTLDHIDCLKYPSCCLVSPVFVDCSILIGEKCPLMHQSELLMVIIELYFQQNYDCSAKISALICYVLSKFSTFKNWVTRSRNFSVLAPIHTEY